MISEQTKKVLMGNWELSEAMRCYAPVRLKTTHGHVAVYPYALNPADNDDCRFVYHDPGEIYVMQGSLEGMLNSVEAHGFTLERDYEYVPRIVSYLVNHLRGVNERGE